MIDFNETIERLMSVDGDFSKLYLYMFKNKITEINNDNIKDISQKTFIPFNKMTYIINYFKEKEILPENFVFKNNFIKNENIKEKIYNAEIIELSSYCQEKFNTDFDYKPLFANIVNYCSFSKEIYKYLIDICSLEKKYQDYSYMYKTILDWEKNKFNNIDEIKNYLMLRNFNNCATELKENGRDILSNENLNKKQKNYDNYDYSNFR